MKTIDKILIALGLSIGSGMFWGNFNMLVPHNPNYVASWWKVVGFGIMFLYFCWYLYDKAEEAGAERGKWDEIRKQG